MQYLLGFPYSCSCSFDSTAEACTQKETDMNTIADSTSASYVSSDSSDDESGFLITNETLGNIDKRGSLGELNENRLDIISSPTGC